MKERTRHNEGGTAPLSLLVCGVKRERNSRRAARKKNREVPLGLPAQAVIRWWWWMDQGKVPAFRLFKCLGGVLVLKIIRLYTCMYGLPWKKVVLPGNGHGGGFHLAMPGEGGRKRGCVVYRLPLETATKAAAVRRCGRRRRRCCY